MEEMTMTTWLIHYAYNGRKAWTTVEAKSPEKARDLLLNDGNVFDILHIEAIKDNEPVIEEESWNDDKILF